MAEFSFGDAVLGTAIDLSGLDDGIKEGEEHARSGFSKIGDAIGDALKVGLAGAAAAIAGVAVKGIADFTSFQGKMNEVFTLLPGISGDAMHDMSEQVKQFATDMKVLPEDVVPALYQSISAGVPKENVFDFLTTAQQAAKGGVTELSTAVDGISSVVNAYGADVLGATQASDLMFTAVRLGKTDFTQLSQSLFNVTPVASALGVKFGDVTAALAAMTAQGTPTSVATTQIRSALVELSKDGTQTSKIFREVAGKSFKEFIASGGNLQQALQLLEKKARASGLGINDLFSSVEAGSAALALTGKGTDVFTADLQAMTDSAGATQAAYDRMNDGIGPAIDELKATFSVFLLDVGERLAPFVTDIAETLGEVLPRAADAAIGALDGLVSLIDAFQTGAEGGDFLGGIANALYSLDGISPIFDTIGDGVVTLAGLFDDLTAEGGGLGVLLDDIREMTGIDLSPVLDVFQGLADTFTAAEDPITGFLDVLSEVSPTFELLRGIVEAALPPIESIVESVFGIIAGLIEDHGAKMLADVTSAWQGIQAIIDNILPPIESIVETVFGAIAQFLDAHGAEIEAVLAKAWDTIAMVVDAALKLINATIVPAFEYIASFLSAHSEEIQQILGGAWKIISGIIDAALTLIQGIIKSAMQLIQGDFSGAWQTIQDTNEQLWEDFKQVLSGAWDVIKGLVSAGVDAVVGQFLGMPAKVAGVGQAVVQQIWDGIKARWGELEAWFTGQLQALRDQLPFSEPKDTSSPLYGLSDAGAAIIDQITLGMRGVAGLLPATMRDVGGQATDALQSAIDDLGHIFDDSDAPDQVEGLGSDILSSLAMGLADNVGHAVFAATQAAQEVIGAIEDAFKMHSPSQVMIDIGSNVLLGLIIGIQDLTPDLYDAISDAAAVIVDAMDLPIDQVAEKTQQVVAQLIDQIHSLQDAAERAIEDAMGGAVDLGRAEEHALGAVDRFQGSIQNEFEKDQQARDKFVDDQMKGTQAAYEAQMRQAQAEAAELAKTDAAAAQKLLEDRNRAATEAFIKRQQEILDAAQHAGTLSDFQKDNLTRLGQGVEDQIRQAQAEADKLAETDPEAAAKFFQMRQKQIMELADLQKQFILSNDDQERARLAERMRLLEDADKREQELFERRRTQNSNSTADLAKQIQELLDKLTITDDTSPAAAAAFNQLYQLLVHLRQVAGLKTGTDFWEGGWAWVGEDGPELLNLPRGAQVLPVPRLGSLAASGAGIAPSSRMEIDLSLNLNSRGLDWLERLIDARIDNKTGRAAAAADSRRRTR
jgi:TP901 family phage tail tape measure protein